MPPNKQTHITYEQREKVLCYHGELIYEAKILELKLNDPKDKKAGYQYLVHYNGWKNTWDDWVAEDRLLKLNDANKELANTLQRDLKQREQEKRDAHRQKKLSVALSSTKKKSNAQGSDMGSGRGSEERSSSVQAMPNRGTKRGRDWEIEKEEAFMSKPAIRIPLPDNLKGLLVDDWENVTKNLQIVPLPHPHPITQILSDYRAHESPRRRPGSSEADILDEVIQGVREYFDKALGRILLYRFERQQWLEVSERIMQSPGTTITGARGVAGPDVLGDQDLAGRTPADIYGPEHLCRLFVSMPELIAQTNMDTQSVARLKEELVKMTGWLGRNAKTYFAKEYMHPGQTYEARAKGPQ